MKKKELLVIAILFLFQIQFVRGQNKHTVSGMVKDAKTGESLIGASIKLTDSILGTVTNEYGFYSLNVPDGNYELTAVFVGYKTIKHTVSVKKDLLLNLTMVENNQLNEVVITESKRNDNVANPQMGLERINIKEIKNMPVLFGEPDVLKTIQLLPGIKSAGEGNSGFYVRGGSTDQNLILLDEATVYNASHLLGFFSTFNSDAIKNITLYKGGMPAQYGGRLSSVLDIRMDDGNRKDYDVEGGIGLIASRLKIEGPIVKDKGSFMVSARRTYADAFLSLSSDSTVNQSTLFFYDVNAKANYQFDDKNTIYLSGYFGRDDLGIAESFGFNWGNATVTLRWNHLISNKLFSNTSLIYSKYNYEIENLIKDNNFKVNSSIRDYNLKEDFEYNMSNNHHLKFGFNAVQHTLAPGKFTTDGTSSINEATIQDHKGAELAVYISDEWMMSNQLSIVYGLRLSRFSSQNLNGKSYFNPEPRLSASYMVDSTSSFKAAYTRNTQNIHLMSNSTSTSPTDLYIMNSNIVKPEIADQVALGYFRNLNQDKYEFSAEIYYKWMQHQIEYRNGTDLIGNNNVEADLLFGDGRAYGIELFFKKRFGKFNGWIGYTLSKTERQFDAINNGNWFYAKQDRTHDISLAGTFKAGKRWSLSSVFVYSTGNAVTYPSAKYQVSNLTVFYYKEKNGYRTPAYHRLDLSATLEGKPNKKFQSSWSFGIYNVYNHHNTYAIDFQNNPDDATKTEAVRTTLFGFIPSVTWNFKF